MKVERTCQYLKGKKICGIQYCNQIGNSEVNPCNFNCPVTVPWGQGTLVTCDHRAD